MNATQYDLVLKAKSVVFTDGVRPATIGVKDGTTVEIGSYNTPLEALRHIELPDSQVLFPGFVDSHVHINEPGRTDWEGYESATRAGLAGGITTILDMPLNSSPPTTTVANLDEKIKATAGKLSVDVGLWGGAVPGNIVELKSLWDRGVFGFKCFTAHSGLDEYGWLDYPHVREVLKEIARLEAVLIVHAEDPQDLARAPQIPGPKYSDFLASRPRKAENDAIKAVIDAAKETGARVHLLHLSSSDAIGMIQEAKAQGVRLTVETCPHYLSLNSESIPDGATQYKCCPPLRENENRIKLWEAVLDGTIDHIASDHSPCTVDLKHLDKGDFAAAWGGIASVQLGLPVIWTYGQEFGLKPEDIARLFSSNPARNFDIPRKGSIKVGNDADFAIVDLNEKFTVCVDRLEHKNKLSPYQGKELKGTIKHTILRGQVVDRNSKIGRLIQRG